MENNENEEEFVMEMVRKWNESKLMQDWKAFWKQEEGVGVIEVVLILVVLIGLVIIFKSQIQKLLNNIFKEIEKQSKEVY